MYSVLQNDRSSVKKKMKASNLRCFVRYIFQQEYSVFPCLGSTRAKPSQLHHHMASLRLQGCQHRPAQLFCFDLQPEPQATDLFTASLLGAWVISPLVQIEST